MRKNGSDRLCWVSGVATRLPASSSPPLPPVPFCPRRGVGLAPPQDGDRLRQKEGGVHFPGKGLVCHLSAKFSSKQQVLGAHKAPIPKPHPQAFPRKSSYLKCITQLKVPFYYSVGENVQSSMYNTFTPTKLLLRWVVFSYKRKF